MQHEVSTLWPAKVAAILDNLRVIMNRGSIHGVEEGQTFVAYYESEPIKDPDTQEILGVYRHRVRKLTVTEVDTKLSVLRSADYDFELEEFDDHNCKIGYLLMPI